MSRAPRSICAYPECAKARSVPSGSAVNVSGRSYGPSEEPTSPWLKTSGAPVSRSTKRSSGPR